MSRLSVLMTVFNEADFIDFAIRGCLPYVDDLVIVEGSYVETQKLNQPARSNDGTVDIIEKYKEDPKVHIIYANEYTDKDQRNVGLQKIKELNPDGYLCIIDGDEIYEPNTFSLIKKYAIPSLEKNNKKVRYFASRTFINDFYHFCWQQFPRLFKIEKDCKFVNDNQMWYNQSEQNTILIDRPIDDPSSDKIKYFHYSFLKGYERFKTKRDWWMNRGLGKDFDYGWKINDKGLIVDETNKNHKPLIYTGKQPEIMKVHPQFMMMELLRKDPGLLNNE